MLDLINKQEYFDWLDQKIANPRHITLKGIQDSWILAFLQRTKNLRIAEIGGGASRVLGLLSMHNDCWNIDKMEGLGNGPTQAVERPRTKLIRSYMGDFDSDIPSNYFDVVFSISVVEHISKENLEPFFLDCHRILKPGAVMLHAIDLYIFDQPHKKVQIIDTYRQCIESHDFTWLLPPAIDGQATFRCGYASNSDTTMNAWNHSVPSLAPIREISQSVSIKMCAFKDSDEMQDLLQGLTISTENVVSEASNDSRGKDLKDKTSNFISDTPGSSDETSSVLSCIDDVDSDEGEASAKAISALTRVVAYYRGWPAIVAILAIMLNMTASLLVEPFQQIFSASSIFVVLFLVAYTASKTSYALTELERVQAEHRRTIKTLRQRLKRLAIRQRKSSNQ